MNARLVINVTVLIWVQAALDITGLHVQGDRSPHRAQPDADVLRGVHAVKHGARLRFQSSMRGYRNLLTGRSQQRSSKQ